MSKGWGERTGRAAGKRTAGQQARRWGLPVQHRVAGPPFLVGPVAPKKSQLDHCTLLSSATQPERFAAFWKDINMKIRTQNNIWLVLFSSYQLLTPTPAL